MHAKNDKINSLLKWGLIILASLMPFHAFLAIFIGHVFGHQALWQAWKEVLILAMTLASLALICQRPELRKRLLTPVNLAASAFITIALLVSLAAGAANTTAFWFGIKTDLLFVFLFAVAQLAPTLQLRRQLLRILLATTLVVCSIAVLQVSVMPVSLLRSLGYNSITIQPLQLVDPAVSAVRAFSTLGGPNQLGAYLILPLCYILAAALKKWRPWHAPAFVIVLAALALTYSRSSWIGAAIALAVTTFVALSRRGRTIFAGGLVALIVLLAMVIPPLSKSGPAQYYLRHSSATPTSFKSSNLMHLESINAGLKVVGQHPFGLGLGSAGPASKYGTTLITENYYLQLAVETGILGLLAFITLQVLVGIQLWQLRHIASAKALLGALVGVSIVNLFLHGWADSTLAYVYWILAGNVIGYKSYVKTDPA